MRILHISDVYFPRVNGVSTSIRTFRNELTALGHEITLIAPAYPESGADDDARIMRIPSTQVPFDPEDRLMQARALRSVRSRLGARTFDIVHIHTPFIAHYTGVRIARELRIPCVATYHTFFEEYLHHYIPVAPRLLTRAAARAISRSQGNEVDALIVPSRAMLNMLTAYGVQKPMQIVPTGIPLEEFRGGDGTAFRLRHGLPLDCPLLLHVGRAAFEKNIGFLLEVFKLIVTRLPQARFVVTGEGPALNELKRLARRLAIQSNVHFIGYLERARELIDCYRSADAFIFGSRTETQGLVLLEAMALGVPVVAIAELGALDILEPRRGALIAPADVPAFAAEVVRVLESPSLKQALAVDARTCAAEWNAREFAIRLAEFYAQCISVHAAANIKNEAASATAPSR